MSLECFVMHLPLSHSERASSSSFLKASSAEELLSKDQTCRPFSQASFHILLLAAHTHTRTRQQHQPFETLSQRLSSPRPSFRRCWDRTLAHHQLQQPLHAHADGCVGRGVKHGQGCSSFNVSTFNQEQGVSRLRNLGCSNRKEVLILTLL